MSSNEWKQVKLSEVCEYGKDKLNINDLELTNYISTENMLPEKAGVTIASGLPISKTLPAFKMGDVLVSNIRPYFKKIWFANKTGGCSNDVLVFRAKRNIYDNKFLYYNLSFDGFFDYSMSTSKGTKMPRGDKSALMNYIVPLIPLSEQKSIAATLSCLDDMIELNNRTNQILEEIAQAIFKSWFIDFEFPNEDGEPYKSSGGEMVVSELGKIPKGWRVGTLDECIDFINGYAFASKDLLDEYAHNCYHVFKMGHIKKGGGFNSDGTKSYVPKDGFDLNSKYILRKGDLLMCMTDMKANVALLGHTALMNEDNKYVVNQRVGLLRINNDIGISYPYLYILTNSKDFIENLRGRANSGVQVNLSTNEIKASKMLIAPRYINEEFNNTVKALFDELFLITSENNKLTQIRDTLLPKLISGQIRVPVEEVV